MTRNITLTIKLKLELDEEVSLETLQNHLSNAIDANSVYNLRIDTEALELVALHDPLGTLSQVPQLESVLADFEQAASIWSIEDVLDICPSLTRDEAWHVLRSVTDRSDCNSGIQPFSFTDAIENLFGIGS
jgi:hypothetical protein